MKRGRKNLKRAVEDEMSNLVDGHSVMQVVSLRGSNIIEVMDSKGDKLIAIFPAKFQKSMWIRIGNFVVVDESGREEAVESGRKVAGMVTQVLYHDQVRLLKKSLDCMISKAEKEKDTFVTDTSYEHRPEIFKPTLEENLMQSTHSCTSQQEEGSSREDDGLPPLEAITNRVNPLMSGLDIELEGSSSEDEGLPPLEENTNRVNPLMSGLGIDSESDTDIDS